MAILTAEVNFEETSDYIRALKQIDKADLELLDLFIRVGLLERDQVRDYYMHALKKTEKPADPSPNKEPSDGK